MAKLFSFSQSTHEQNKTDRDCWYGKVDGIVEFKANSEKRPAQKLTGQTDKYLVILSSKTYVFEDNMTKY